MIVQKVGATIKKKKKATEITLYKLFIRNKYIQATMNSFECYSKCEWEAACMWKSHKGELPTTEPSHRDTLKLP